MRAHSTDLDDLCHREYPRLAGAMTLYTGDRELGCELAQEALARMCRDWSKVSRLDAPGSWAHRVALNLAKSTFRRRAIERRARRAVEAEPADDEPDPATRVANATRVRAALAELSPRQRSAVVLRYYVDLSITETAEVMGCAPGTVTALCSQAAARLRAEAHEHDAPIAADPACGDPASDSPATEEGDR